MYFRKRSKEFLIVKNVQCNICYYLSEVFKILNFEKGGDGTIRRVNVRFIEGEMSGELHVVTRARHIRIRQMTIGCQRREAFNLSGLQS